VVRLYGALGLLLLSDGAIGADRLAWVMRRARLSSCLG
jgi:hypothetical protein